MDELLWLAVAPTTAPGNPYSQHDWWAFPHQFLNGSGQIEDTLHASLWAMIAASMMADHVPALQYDTTNPHAGGIGISGDRTLPEELFRTGIRHHAGDPQALPGEFDDIQKTGMPWWAEEFMYETYSPQAREQSGSHSDTYLGVDH
jgi:hypothetical protein